MNVLPGEPVPPGFEDEVNRTAEIQHAIDAYKGNALVGLEYSVELYDEGRPEPGYICVLCDKRGDPRTVMQHWTSFNHRMKYFERHFPSAAREFSAIKYKPNSQALMNQMVQALSEAIEDHHGRKTLSVMNADDFRRIRSQVIQQVKSKPHFDEKCGPNFLNIIDRTMAEYNAKHAPASVKNAELIQTKPPVKRASPRTTLGNRNGDGLDEISSDDENQEVVKKSKKPEQVPAYRVLPRVRRSPPFEEERLADNENKLPTPKELSLQASHIAQERYKWEKYSCMMEIHIQQMKKLEATYKKNPEKHPLYPDEWKKFWNRRYKELQKVKGVDPNKYDYKPEWISFWSKRMKEIFKFEMDQKQKEFKKKIGLPEDAEEKIDQLREKYKVTVGGKAVERGNNEMHNDATHSGKPNQKNPSKLDVIDISDDEEPRRFRRRSNSRSRSRSRSRSSMRRHSRSKSRSSQSYSRRDNKRTRGHSKSMSPLPARHHHHRSRSPEYYGRGNRAPAHAMSRAYPPDVDYYSAQGTYSRTRYPPHKQTAGVYGHYRVMEPHQLPKYERSPTPNSKSNSGAKESADLPELEDEGSLTVVSVLRLLTALEDHLGSLGPKVVDLLGKALALEKVKANSADELLLNDDHCVFFETIKEKLKGLLIAEVLDDPQKVRAVKKTIQNIAAVIHQVTTKGKEAEKASEEQDKSTKADGSTGGAATNAKQKKKFSQPNIQDLPFDRQIVATKLAAALVLEGRDDVSTQDMDKLIYFFVLLVKLSKSKYELDGSPLHMRDVLPELGIIVPEDVSVAALSDMDALIDNDAIAAAFAVAADEDNDESAGGDSKADSSGGGLAGSMEALTDSDLQTLLQNFKFLSTDEQHHLIAHLKKLETTEPTRVEKLRKYVNVDDGAADTADSGSNAAAGDGSNSSGTQRKSNEFAQNSMRSQQYNDSPASRNNNSRDAYISDDDAPGIRSSARTVHVNPNKFSLDDDEDDDYNFDDVCKEVTKNVKRAAEEQHSRNSGKSSTSAAADLVVPTSSNDNALTFNPAGLNKMTLSDTQNIIANLMGSLQKSNANKGEQHVQPVASVVPSSDMRKQHQQQQQQQQQQASMPYYQQQPQQQQAYAGYNNPMGDQQAAYYNNMAGYNNPGAGYPGYQQPWGNGQPQMPNMPNMQPQYGMPNYGAPQQQQPNPMGGYGMYGGGN